MSPEEKPYLMIAAEEWIPWSRINTLEDGNFTVSGPMGNILSILATLLFFNYKIIRPENRYWGKLDSSGNWTGMIGMLDRKVWLLVFVSTVFVCATMFLVASTEGSIFNVTSTDYLSKSSMWVIQTFTQESSEWLPKGIGGRLLVATWLLASLVFMSSYSGILTAMLTIPKAPAPIDSLEDLVSQTKIPWRLESAFLFHYFQDSESELHKAALERSSGTFHGCWGIRQEVVDGDYAGLCEKTTVRKVIHWDFSNSGNCHLHKSRENVVEGNVLALAFKTKSAYLPRANKIINSLKEAGLVEKWLEEQIANYSHCLKPPSSSEAHEIYALDIESISGPFIFLVGGLLMAMMTFVCEVVCASIQAALD